MANIEMLAFDIGGVLARLDKTLLFELLKKKGLTKKQFFDEDFFLLQKGLITSKEFFTLNYKKFGLLEEETRFAFTSIISVIPEVNIINSLALPYFFMSNINDLHFQKFISHASPSHHALKHSVLSYKIGCLKPDINFFKFLDFISIKRSSILFIDDQLNNLVQAKKVGLKIAWCQNPLSLPLIFKAHGLG